MTRDVTTILDQFGRRVDVETDADGMRILVTRANFMEDPARFPLSDDEAHALIVALGGTVAP